MADYIYLLENRLSPAQRDAVRAVAELIRSKALTVFLVGGAVRDLTSGSPVRDLDLVVQGNVLKLRKDLERIGATISGEHDAMQSLYLRFPGGVRMELSSTMTVTWPKPGKPVARPAGIQDDLRRRDFTANAMALSLNEGSYGLLMDPLNGVADIENRELRLISNYGFIEEPVRMIRAARLMARLGWNMEERTAARYRTGKEENYVAVLSDFHRGYETEEIFHEEDPMRVLSRLEVEGWMANLAPFLTSAKVNVAELERLREVQTRLQMQGIQPDSAATSFPLLTARLGAAEIASLKASFPRKGFVAEIDGLDAEVKQLTAQLTGKQTAQPSETWKLLHQAAPEVVLAVAFSARGAVVQAKLKSFESEWPQAKQKIPYQMMQEMRIVPELPGYAELVDKLFFELMDDHLATPEAMRAYLEPYSPPAPPPPVSLRKPRAAKKEAKAARPRRGKAAEDAEEVSVEAAADETEVSPAEAEVALPIKATGKQIAAPQAEPVVKRAEPITLAKVPPVKVAPVKAVAASAPAAKSTGVKTAAAKSVAAKAVPAKKQSATVKTPAAKSAPPKAKAPVPVNVSASKKLAGKSAQKAVPAKALPAKVARKAAPVKAAAKMPAKAAKSAKAASSAPAKSAKKAVTLPGKGFAAKAKAVPAKAAKAPFKTAGKSFAKAVPAKKTAARAVVKTAKKTAVKVAPARAAKAIKAAAKKTVVAPKKAARKR